jgi:release factor glutamine methyltransferase
MTLTDAITTLTSAGVPSPEHDARVLAAQPGCFEELVGRRAGREPLQYIVGSAPFRHLAVLVGPGAFIPRPETELVAGWVIEMVTPLDEPIVVDLCSGPGTIALSVAQEVPHARVHAVEVDAAAAAWARRNVEATGLEVTLAVAAVSDAVPELNGRVDAVVANPPYIVRGTIDQAEVRDFEPEIALYDEGDGLGHIRDVVTAARRLLRPGGFLAIEHGDDQAGAVTDNLRAAGFRDVADHQDLTGRDRFATGRL